MSRRRERLTRPVRRDEWELVAITNQAAKEWAELEAVEANALARAYDQLTRDPAAHSDRQHRMKGNYATGQHEGDTFDRWQYEVTAAGRIWYFVENPRPGPKRPSRGRRPRRRVPVEAVFVGHPKATE